MDERQARDAMNRKATVIAEDFLLGRRVRGTIAEVDRELDGSLVACVIPADGFRVALYFSLDEIALV